MNTAGSVAYGWGALIVAAGVSYYYAKKEIDVKRKDAQTRGTRPTEKLTWEERIAQTTQDKAYKPAQDAPPAPGKGFIPPEAK